MGSAYSSLPSGGVEPAGERGGEAGRHVLDDHDALHRRLVEALAPGGYLVVGTSERVADPRGLGLTSPFCRSEARRRRAFVVPGVRPGPEWTNDWLDA